MSKHEADFTSGMTHDPKADNFAAELRAAETWLSGTVSSATKKKILEAARRLERQDAEITRLRKLLQTAVAFIGAGEVEGSMERWLRRAEKELEQQRGS